MLDKIHFYQAQNPIRYPSQYYQKKKFMTPIYPISRLVLLYSRHPLALLLMKYKLCLHIDALTADHHSKYLNKILLFPRLHLYLFYEMYCPLLLLIFNQE